MFAKVGIAAGLSAALFVAAQLTAAAASDPYTTGSVGYDYSYPQCGVFAPAAKFGIVGVNGGYPFTYYNNCLAAEFAAAKRTGNAAVYINTGYSPKYTRIDGRHMLQDCATKSGSISGTRAQQMAWGVGCSEAERDMTYAAQQSVTGTTGWWLDVETANSWSTSDLSLNTYTINGIIATLRPNGTPIGVYSTPAMWNAITGGYQAPVDADWLATGQTSLTGAQAYCGGTGFTGAAIWLVQYVTTIDNDYAC